MKICNMVMQDVNRQLFSESVMDEVLLGIFNLWLIILVEVVEVIYSQIWTGK